MWGGFSTGGQVGEGWRRSVLQNLFFREERRPKGKTKHTGKESRKEEFMSGKVQGAKLKSKRSAPKRAPTKTGFKTKSTPRKNLETPGQANGVSVAFVPNGTQANLVS